MYLKGSELNFTNTCPERFPLWEIRGSSLADWVGNKRVQTVGGASGGGEAVSARAGGPGGVGNAVGIHEQWLRCDKHGVDAGKGLGLGLAGGEVVLLDEELLLCQQVVDVHLVEVVGVLNLGGGRGLRVPVQAAHLGPAGA